MIIGVEDNATPDSVKDCIVLFSCNGNGNVGVNKLDPASHLDVSGNIRYSGTIASSSDYRIKKDIKGLDSSFSVDKLRPIYYRDKMFEQENIGLIAHELQEYYPYLVNGVKDGEDIQSVNYIGLIGLLIHEIQQLKKDIINLNNKFDDIQNI